MAQPKHPPAFYMRRYGIPEWLGNALIGQESGGSDTARSSKNALGRMQIHLPSHPDVSEAEARDPDFAMDYGFRLLAGNIKEFGSIRLGLAAYNAGAGAVRKYGGVPPYAETRDYVASIMSRRPAAGAKQTAMQVGPTQQPTRAQGAPTGASILGGSGKPDLEASTALGLQRLISGDYNPTEQVAELAATARRAAPVEAPVEADPLTEAPSVGASSPAGGSDFDWRKWVVRPPAGQGPSAPHSDEILQFVGRIGRRNGSPLTPWANESHSLTTVNGTPSAHATGRAADIPARGAKLRRLGYLALLDAGMSKKEALKAARKGGLYNVGGYQIIFATQIGGDHSDHLHVGIRG